MNFSYFNKKAINCFWNLKIIDTNNTLQINTAGPVTSVAIKATLDQNIIFCKMYINQSMIIMIIKFIAHRDLRNNA